MTSVHGYFETYDYSSFADPNVVYPPCQKLRTYPPKTIMAILDKHSPKLAFLIKLSGLDWQLADLQNKVTFFAFPEETLDEHWVKNCDKETARKFIKYQMTMGFLPEDVLKTSFKYNLRTTLKGQDVTVEMMNGLFYYNGVPIISYNNYAVNGVIHVLQQPYAITNSSLSC